MTQQMHPARDRGLRRIGLVTACLAAAGVVGTGAAAYLAHADSLATSTTTSTTTGTTTDGVSSSGSVSSGNGTAPQARSAGS
jgi:hypothetical protein